MGTEIVALHEEEEEVAIIATLAITTLMEWLIQAMLKTGKSR
jgi:hypothetical protein